MIRSYRFELLKLRRRSVGFALVAVALLSVLSTALTFGLAGTGSPDRSGYSPTLGQLAGHRGLTAGFSAGASVLGLLIFVVFLVATTSEFSGGTVRAILLRQPNRIAWAAGKAAALLTTLVVAVSAAVVAGGVAAVLAAQTRNIPTGAWFSADGWGHTVGTLLSALVGVGLYGVAGIALGLLVRSTVVALASGIAWAFPLEHITQNTWPGATGVFPGLTFDAIARGGVQDASFGHALALGITYGTVGFVVALVLLARRDVTA